MSNPQQRTAAWFAARTGCLTASVVEKILPQRTPKGEIARDKEGNVKYNKSRETLKNVIIAERLTEAARENFVSAAMQWGIDHEDDARERYQIETGELVDLVGFLKHPNVRWLGASPDGLVGEDGLIEIKCPESSKHVEYLRSIRSKVVPDDYKAQMTLQLIVTGRQWCDFVTYDPRMKEPQTQIGIIRYKPTGEERVEMLDECVKFLRDVGTVTNCLLDKE